MADGPTHFHCAYHDETFPTKEYQAHCDEKHDGMTISVQPIERRCVHGTALIHEWNFCCDYGP